MDDDKLTEAYNRYEELLDECEENDYPHGWIYYRLKEGFGEEIARMVYRECKKIGESNYKKAKGSIPWEPGGESPKDAIRRLRDGNK